MESLGQRANILRERIDEKDVYIYEDHRYLFYVTWLAAQRGVINPPIPLVFFDAHDDLRDLSQNVMSKIATISKATDEREILSFVEWDLFHNDSDWLKALFEFNLVSDAVLIGCDRPINIVEREYPYQDHNGTIHKVYSIPHLWSALNHQGKLADGASNVQYGPIWDVIGWHPAQYPDGFTDKPILLDFDLDCFVYQPLEGVAYRAWEQEIFDELFDRTSNAIYTTNWTGFRYLQGLLSKARYVTIARESEYCHGTENSEKILQSVISLFPAQGYR